MVTVVRKVLTDQSSLSPLPNDSALCASLCPHGHDHACARSPKHLGPHRDLKQKGTESCSWVNTA